MTASPCSSTSTSSTARRARTSTSPASRASPRRRRYATFLLYGLFHSGVLGPEAVNTKALVFNVKGEDLLFLDHPNSALAPEQARALPRTSACRPNRSPSVGVWAPPRRDGVGDGVAAPDVASRSLGVRSFFWTIHDFCEQGLLPFLFADAEDDRQQYTMVVHNVAAELQRAAPRLRRPGQRHGDLRRHRRARRSTNSSTSSAIACSREDGELGPWAGRAITGGTVNAFLRRLHGATRHLRHLIRADVARPDQHSVAFDHQVTVVDIHNLNDRAQRFVVGVLLRRAFDAKERAGTARPLQLIVLDELNKYAPREGSSPIKEILLDVAERGRSLGIVLIGCQQTASEVERRVVANSAVRVVGRLDPAEAGRGEYGFLPPVQRQRATIVKPGTMIVSQPMLPVPIVLEFPFPAWATRSSEAGAEPDGRRGRRCPTTRSRVCRGEVPAHRRLARRAHHPRPIARSTSTRRCSHELAHDRARARGRRGARVRRRVRHRGADARVGAHRRTGRCSISRRPARARRRDRRQPRQRPALAGRAAVARARRRHHPAGVRRPRHVRRRGAEPRRTRDDARGRAARSCRSDGWSRRRS